MKYVLALTVLIILGCKPLSKVTFGPIKVLIPKNLKNISWEEIDPTRAKKLDSLFNIKQYKKFYSEDKVLVGITGGKLNNNESLETWANGLNYILLGEGRVLSYKYLGLKFATINENKFAIFTYTSSISNEVNYWKSFYGRAEGFSFGGFITFPKNDSIHGEELLNNVLAKIKIK